MTTGNPNLPTDKLIEVLRHSVQGRVVGPADADWPAERLAWHVLVPQNPAAIVHVSSVADVQAVIRIAVRRGLKVAAQPRGHGATPDVADGTILLRFGALKDIEINGDIARVGAGVQWRELNNALEGTGLTSLPGSNGDTSVVGYTVSGGLSWFGRKYGLAANQVRAFDLVDASGTHFTVTAETHPDLFWAVRGGGGEFGIVTAMELDLLPAEQIYGGRLMWYAEHSRDLLRAFQTINETAPDELTLWAWLINMPDADFVPAALRGRWTFSVDATFLGDPDEAEKLLAPLRAVAQPLVDGLSDVPLGQLTQIAQEPEDPTPAMGRIRLLTEFGPAAIDALLELLLDGPTPIALVQIRHLGGAFARPRSGDGSAGSLDEPYLVLLGGIAVSPELPPLIEQAFDSTTAGLARFLSDRVPPNLATAEPIEQLYPAATLSRLRQIKTQVDPTNVIRGNHPLTSSRLENE